MTPGASVVITTKNRSAELVRALKSAVLQTIAIEIIVIDDGSTDGTADMVRTFFPQVRFLRHEHSRGLIVRRNEAARIAQGEYIFSLDDDAEFASPKVVEQTLTQFNCLRVGAVAIPYIDINQGSLSSQRAPEKEKVWVTDRYIGTAHAVRRGLFLKLGGYCDEFIHQGEEGDFCIRLLNAGYFVRVGRSDPIVHHESTLRSFPRMDFYGRRNDILYTWRNVPWPYFPIHLVATTLNGLGFAMRTRSFARVRDMIGGLIEGYAQCIGYFSARHPVSRRIYRLSRKLKKRGPLPLELKRL